TASSGSAPTGSGRRSRSARRIPAAYQTGRLRAGQGVVTTAASGDPAEARDLARRFGLRAEDRAGRTLAALLDDAAGAPVPRLAARRADLHEKGRSFRATAGMAYLRLLRARRGEPDPLVAAAGLNPGETVL